MEKTEALTQIVKKAQKDPDAFAQLYAQTVSFSYAVARSYLSNPQDIEDVLQTSYMYAAKSLPDLREPENFLSWMRTIVVHECQKCLKNNRKFSDLLRRSQEAAVEKDDLSEWTDILEQHERYEAVRAIMDSLPSEQRMCAALFYYEGKSIAEIAELLQISEGTVKSRLYHARRKFEKAMKKLSMQDGVFIGVPPLLVLRSYFRYGEKETASLALRKSVWASLVTQGAASGGTGALVSSGLGSAAVSAGAAVPTAIKAAAIALTAVTAVGGGVTAVKHIQSGAAPAKETVMTVTEAEKTANRFFSPETSGSLTETADVVRQSTTGSFVTTDSQSSTARHTVSSVIAASAAAETTRQPAEVPQSATQSQGMPTTARSTTAAAANVPATTATQRQNTTAPTRAALTTQPTTQAAAAAAQYQMTGGVLRSYTGSESSVTIPSTINGETVTAIGSGAFAQNETMRSVQIPNGVTQIGQQAFSDCTALQSVSLPSSLRSIGAGAFDGCTSLSSVTVPSGTTAIGDDAFSGCRSLRQITVPSSVTSIGDDAFGGCDDLTIRCVEGSAAHTYAVDHGISYQVTTD